MKGLAKDKHRQQCGNGQRERVLKSGGGNGDICNHMNNKNKENKNLN